MNEKTEFKFNALEVLESLACGDPYLRRSFIGASDAPAIMGVSPWKTKYRLWQEKCGLVSCEIPSEAMERGNRLEPIARSLFEEFIGVNVQPKRFFSEKHDWMMASLDGIDDSGEIAVEIKCPGKYCDHVPDHYMPQLQHQMFVANLKEIYYFSYVEEQEIFIELVKRNDEYIDKLIKAETEFWECVKACTPPEMSNKDFIKREDKEWTDISDKWNYLKKMKEEILFEEEILKKQIIDLCEGFQCEGKGMKVQKILKKGSIDYSSIYELKDIDLEKYRKKDSEYWKISLTEEE